MRFLIFNVVVAGALVYLLGGGETGLGRSLNALLSGGSDGAHANVSIPGTSVPAATQDLTSGPAAADYGQVSATSARPDLSETNGSPLSPEMAKLEKELTEDVPAEKALSSQAEKVAKPADAAKPEQIADVPKLEAAEVAAVSGQAEAVPAAAIEEAAKSEAKSPAKGAPASGTPANEAPANEAPANATPVKENLVGAPKADAPAVTAAAKPTAPQPAPLPKPEAAQVAAAKAPPPAAKKDAPKELLPPPLPEPEEVAALEVKTPPVETPPPRRTSPFTPPKLSEKGGPGKKTAETAEVKNLPPDVAKRRAEILDGIDEPSAAPRKAAPNRAAPNQDEAGLAELSRSGGRVKLKDGTVLMSPQQRSRELRNLADELELLFLEKTGG